MRIDHLAALFYGMAEVSDATNWVGAIDRDIGVALRYGLTLRSLVSLLSKTQGGGKVILRQKQGTAFPTLDFPSNWRDATV